MDILDKMAKAYAEWAYLSQVSKEDLDRLLENYEREDKEEIVPFFTQFLKQRERKTGTKTPYLPQTLL